MKIKGVGRFNKFLSKKRALIQKNNFISNLTSVIEKICASQLNEVDVTLIGFSGNGYYYEQLYSALSFLKNIGKPSEWLIVNDGTYSDHQIKTLQKIPGIKVIDFDFKDSLQFSGFKSLAEKHIWGKIFYAYFNILNDLNRTTIFFEADVLIFEGMRNYMHLFKNHNYYLADLGPHFDSHFMKENGRPMLDVNNGFAVFNSRPPLEIAYNYMMDRMEQGNFEYFSPQSAFQLMIKNDANARFFDPRYFVVSSSDQFKIGLDHKIGKKANTIYPGKMVLRHFVGLVRHKMWQTDWRKVLDIEV